MQRGAAKATASSGRSTPNSPNTPGTPTGLSTKRVRLSAGGFAAAGPSDAEVLQQVLDEEERKRQEAIDRAAEKAGESKWVLSIPDEKRSAEEEGALKVSYAGFAVIDGGQEGDLESGEELDSDDEGGNARLTFGGGVKRAKPGPQKGAAGDDEDSSDSDDDDSEDSDSDEDDSDDATAEMIREARREARADKKVAKRRESGRVLSTPKRPNIIDEDMDLRGLDSLSGGRPGGLSGGKGRSDMECFACGKKGHAKIDCPIRSAKGTMQRRGSGRGRGRGGGGLSGRQRF